MTAADARIACDLLGWRWRQAVDAALTPGGTVNVWPSERWHTVDMVQGGEVWVGIASTETIQIAACLRHDVDTADGGRAVIGAGAMRCGLCDGEGMRAGLECDRCVGVGLLPGLGRELSALTSLAAAYRESLPVLADWFMECSGMWNGPEQREHARWKGHNGDKSVGLWLCEWPVMWAALSKCPHVPRTLAECPAIVLWLEAWLQDQRWIGDDGPSLDPHLGEIRSYLSAAWARETEECGQCTDGRVPSTSFDSSAVFVGCRVCNGVGRMRRVGS